MWCDKCRAVTRWGQRGEDAWCIHCEERGEAGMAPLPIAKTLKRRR